MTKVFVDGSAGTTGLRIAERLAARDDIERIVLSEENRKDTEARRRAINESDVSFLCLPDAAAIEAVSLLENDKTVIIDTSTAHRTNDKWAYGFPELTGQRELIGNSKLIANPGCHASGFISLIRPLTECGIIAPDTFLSCFSLTGYSGGGKKMIADYEAEGRDVLLDAPRTYGISQSHKHLPEMVKISGLTKAPAFSPIVSDYYAGMEVSVALDGGAVRKTVSDIKDVYREYYGRGGLVRFVDGGDENGFLAANKLSGKDTMEISVYGNDERITLVSRFDNLGKGASGAAIQNMNIVLGLDEGLGLVTD